MSWVPAFAGMTVGGGSELRCEENGKKHRTILFQDQTRYPLGPVTFEDSLNRELERRAYVALRDAASRSR